MKKVAFLIGCAYTLLTACQSEVQEIDRQVAVTDKEANVSFTFALPVDEELTTRALFGAQSNSAAGGITNVDMNAYDLRYQLAIYRVDAGGATIVAIAPMKKVVDAYQPVTYTLRLTPNRNYKAVVWADFVTQGSENDLHYNTSNFEQITANTPIALNTESRDAYFVTKDFSVGTAPVSESLVLKRPFAKLRLVTTDWESTALEKADNFKLTYYNCKRFKNINLVTGVSESDDLPVGETTFYAGTIDKDNKEYALGYDLTDKNRTLVVDYLMTHLTDQTPIHAKFEALNGTTSIVAHEFKTNVPIQRNWLTTILGNMLTANATFNISINENFLNEWTVAERWWKNSAITPKAPTLNTVTNVYTINNREEFAWIPGNEAALAGKTVVLTDDIDMSGVEWQPIVNNGTYTIDGQGHTLRNFSIDSKFADPAYRTGVKAYTGVWAKFTGTMKNLNFENIVINGRADDTVNQVGGTPVDHSEDNAYFAGCVGYAGANWSEQAEFLNVHAKHIHIRASKGRIVQNIGGLIGWLGTGTHTVENCSVTDAYLVSGDIKGEVGGLIGQVLGGRGITLKGCSTERITIRTGSTAFRDRSGFIGSITDGSSMNFINCTAPTVLNYIDEDGNPITNYPAPTSPFYGMCENNEAGITITP